MTTISERLRRVSGNSPLAHTAQEAADTIDALVDILADTIPHIDGNHWIMPKIEAALAKAKGKQE